LHIFHKNNKKINTETIVDKLGLPEIKKEVKIFLPLQKYIL